MLKHYDNGIRNVVVSTECPITHTSIPSGSKARHIKICDETCEAGVCFVNSVRYVFMTEDGYRMFMSELAEAEDNLIRKVLANFHNNE